MPPTTAHQPDRIVIHNSHSNYFDTLNSPTSIEFKPPTCSLTRESNYALVANAAQAALAALALAVIAFAALALVALAIPLALRHHPIVHVNCDHM